MKVNFKKFLLSAMLVVGIVSSTMVVHATEMPAYKDSPAITAGDEAWKSCSTYTCYAAAETARGSLAYVYFKDYATLSPNFASSNARVLELYLMESDKYVDQDTISGDETIKRYTGQFYGRSLLGITQKAVVTSGNIEEAGDNSVELYFRFQLSKISGDPEEAAYASGLFKYKLGTK